MMSFFIVSGCSVLGIPTTELYAGRFDTVEDFIANNFKPTVKLWMSEDIDSLRSEGVQWRAHFNAMNTSYIRKPVKDLRTYCSSKGGELKQVGFENVEGVKSVLGEQRSPLSAYYRSGAESLRKGEGGAYANTKAWVAFEQQVNANRLISGYAQLSLDVLRAAANDGELGVFACELQGKEIWFAAIEFLRVEVPASKSKGYETPVAVLKVKGKTSNF
jgi:hypothetical protein